MKVRQVYLPVAFLVLLLLSGCVSRYDVRLDALNAGVSEANRGLTFQLVSDTPGVESGDLFFKEVTRQLNSALVKAGFIPMEGPENPDLRIGVRAVLSDPLVETREFSQPIYLDSPGYRQTVRIPIVGKDGKVVRYSYQSYWTGPRTRFAGYVDQERRVTVYDKILHLSADRLDDTGQAGEEVWAITVRLRSESTDYRSALPYMLVAAGPYLGNRTEGEIEVTVREDAPELADFQN